MKRVFRTVAVAAVVIAASCGKDDAPSEMQQQAQEQEELAENLEKTPLEANKVSDNVVIEGSSKNEGNPPTPNQMISLDISGTGKTAFLNEGFDIELSSDATIAGAYIQFKANDGTISDSYYDVDLTTSSQFGKYSIHEQPFGLKSKKGNSLVGKNEGDATVDVDFNANITPGTFCYVVCVYDAQGNISAPSEVCATVESWGGNADLTGNWNMVRSESTYEDNETNVTELGVESCNTSNFQCSDNETLIEYTYCETMVNAKLSLNADGSYEFISEWNEKDIDYDASRENCSTVFEEDNKAVYQSNGFWSYSKNESRFTLVEYSWSGTDNGVLDESETYAEGDADLIYDGNIEISNGAFELFEIYETGSGSETFRSFFEK